MNPTTTSVTADYVHGAIELETTADGLLPHRLPGWARAQCADPQLAMVEAQPAGVRLAFATTATEIAFTARPTKRRYRGLPPPADGIYVLRVDGEQVAEASLPGGNVLSIDMATGSSTLEPGEPGTLRFDGLPEGEKAVEIWLPHNETTELLTLGGNAPLMPVAESRRRWLHHGSSISQGSNAVRPTGTWPAVAAIRADVALTNLGLGGSALLDPFIARLIRDQPADAISLELGINLVNTDLMRLRGFGPAVHGFIDTIRDGHPTTPLLLVSPLGCPMHEDTPGPTAPDLAALQHGQLRFRAAGEASETAAGKLTLAIIRAELSRIVAQRRAGDPHFHYLDGLSLYGSSDLERFPLPDGLHPDAATHELIGSRFAEQAFGPDGLLRSSP